MRDFDGKGECSSRRNFAKSIFPRIGEFQRLAVLIFWIRVAIGGDLNAGAPIALTHRHGMKFYFPFAPFLPLGRVLEEIISSDAAVRRTVLRREDIDPSSQISALAAIPRLPSVRSSPPMICGKPDQSSFYRFASSNFRQKYNTFIYLRSVRERISQPDW
jgi:hypothetical protein